MTDKVLELTAALNPDDPAEWVTHTWSEWNNARQKKMGDWGELKSYLFATDTTSTSNQTLPWKNSTTLPKLTQIRDNLHSNYLSAIFPNDKWLQWTAYTKDAAKRKKAQDITAYMENKTRMSNFRTTVSSLIYDYIDYGNVFGTVVFDKKYNDTGTELIADYIGPRLVRISPEDIVFNPIAADFRYTPKIIRSIKTIGELAKLAQTNPEQGFWLKAIERRDRLRQTLSGYTTEDFRKAQQYSIDGFGDLFQYYMSNYVEVLEFWGDTYSDGVLKTSRVVTVVDRAYTVRDEPISTYSGVAPFFHVGWRLRPDNLWAMGPLDNLVGMQYRIDHLENLKADAMDLAVLPPLGIIGPVEEFDWAPGAEIHIDEGGKVEEIAKNLNAIITSDSQIANLMDYMELFAGAPREAMGVRSPGEKTALEVQTLNNAAGRIFQEKATNFEVNLLEPILNAMLETARRNFDGSDTIVMDTDIGSKEFRDITVDDITADGVIRPIGARHFAQQAQDLQNLVGIANTPLWQQVAPHTSAIELTKFIEDITNLRGYGIFRPNVAVVEQQETAGLVGQAQEDLEVQAATPAETLRTPE